MNRSASLDEYFARTDSGGTASFLTDAVGSTVSLADASGAVQTQYTYEPFGGTTSSGASSTNAFQYTGRENDGSGLYYYRARYYNPALRRFVSQDPIGLDSGDANFYVYVGDAPVDETDPLGTMGGGTFCSALFGGCNPPSRHPKHTYDPEPNVPEEPCFQKFLGEWVKSLVPFPTDDFNPADLLKDGTEFTSATLYNRALSHAAERGLTSPNRSSIFRNLLQGSKAAEELAFPFFVVGSGLWVWGQDVFVWRPKGECR